MKQNLKVLGRLSSSAFNRVNFNGANLDMDFIGSHKIYFRVSSSHWGGESSVGWFNMLGTNHLSTAELLWEIFMHYICPQTRMLS